MRCLSRVTPASQPCLATFCRRNSAFDSHVNNFQPQELFRVLVGFDCADERFLFCAPLSTLFSAVALLGSFNGFVLRQDTLASFLVGLVRLLGIYVCMPVCWNMFKEYAVKEFVKFIFCFFYVEEHSEACISARGVLSCIHFCKVIDFSKDINYYFR